MRWPLVRRSRLDRLQQTRGVYECRVCERLIPLGFGHQKNNGGPCRVVNIGDAGAHGATSGEAGQAFGVSDA